VKATGNKQLIIAGVGMPTSASVNGKPTKGKRGGQSESPENLQISRTYALT
jgi:hypothetical protein